MKKVILLTTFVFATAVLFAQKKVTTSGVISFDASTSLDNLPKAENKTVIAAIDTQTGTIQFEAAVKNFAFANPTMQGHFNGEKWLNSDKFPKFTFSGKITDLSKIDFNKDGTYLVSVTGDLTIKDITKPLTTPGTIIVKDGVLGASAEFSVKLADYEITGVPVEVGKVAKEPKISVSVEMK